MLSKSHYRRLISGSTWVAPHRSFVLFVSFRVKELTAKGAENIKDLQSTRYTFLSLAGVRKGTCPNHSL